MALIIMFDGIQALGLGWFLLRQTLIPNTYTSYFSSWTWSVNATEITSVGIHDRCWRDTLGLRLPWGKPRFL